MNQQEFNDLSYRALEEKSEEKFSHVSWYRWLNKPESSPNLHDVVELAPYFGVSPTELFDLIYKRREANLQKKLQDSIAVLAMITQS
jgi:hypothetical protein